MLRYKEGFIGNKYIYVDYVILEMKTISLLFVYRCVSLTQALRRQPFKMIYIHTHFIYPTEEYI